MPTQNAELSLRRSITGANLPLVPSPTDLYAPDDQDEPRGPIPPILVVPPGMDRDEFIKQVEEAYEIDYTASPDLSPSQNDVAHSIHLMDEGTVALAQDDFSAASDIFSLCNILNPNYYFHFCLATARYQLSDYEGALAQFELAFSQLRSKQQVAPEIAASIQMIDFTDQFYGLYISTLFFNGKIEEMKKIVDFVLEGPRITNPNIYFEIASFFAVFKEKESLEKVAKYVTAIIEDEPDEQRRNQLMSQLKDLLASVE